MEEFTKELLDQLNVDTAFTIGPFAISESVVITWVVMAILVLLSAWLTQGLKVHNPGKKQIVAESIVIWLDKFTISMLGENAKEYSTYISTILLYIGLANIIGIFGMKPPTKDMNVTIALALMSIILIEIRLSLHPSIFLRSLHVLYHCVCVYLVMSLVPSSLWK